MNRKQFLKKRDDYYAEMRDIIDDFKFWVEAWWFFVLIIIFAIALIGLAIAAGVQGSSANNGCVAVGWTSGEYHNDQVYCYRLIDGTEYVRPLSELE